MLFFDGFSRRDLGREHIEKIVNEHVRKKFSLKLEEIVSKFNRHENGSSWLLNSNTLFAASASLQIWKRMSFFKRKLEST